MEGKITLLDLEKKVAHKKQSIIDPVDVYVTNFSHNDHIIKASGIRPNDTASTFSRQLSMNMKKHQDDIVMRRNEERKRMEEEIAYELFGGLKHVNT